MNQISDLKRGDRAEIILLEKGEKFYRQKLLSMGLTPGTVFVLNRIAPFGDPVEIQVRGYALSLRKAEANILKVRKVVECELSK